MYDHHEPVCSTTRRSKLRPGERLYSNDGGHFICSPNGKTRFGYDDEGDLSLWRDRTKIWSANTADMDTYTTMQNDGNLVVYQNNLAVWASNTAEKPGAFLSIEDDGNAKIWLGESMIWSAVNPNLSFLVAGYRWKPNASSLRTRTPSKHTNPNITKNITGQVHQLETTYDHPDPVCSTPRSSKLSPGGLLYSNDGGHFICSPNGKTWFGYDDEGDLSLVRDRRKVWSAKTAGMNTYTTMQNDGNLVVYRIDISGGFPPGAGMVLWSSNTAEKPGSFLSIEDDGNARIWFEESMIWSAVQTSSQSDDSK